MQKNNKKLVIKIDEFVRNNIALILLFLSPTFIAIGGDFAFSIDESKELWQNKEYIKAFFGNNWFFLLAGIVIGLFGLILGYKKQEKQAEYKNNFLDIEKKLNIVYEENERLKSDIDIVHDRLVENWLKCAFNTFSLTSYDRVTIYYEKGNTFYLLARYSVNPTFKKIHSQKFPINKGILSLSWEHGEYKELDCPFYRTNNKGYKTYINDKYQYPKSKIDSFTMKSNLYYGKSIINQGTNIGVILFESINKNPNHLGDKCENIKEFCRSNESYLKDFIDKAIKFDRTIEASSKEINVENDLKNDFQIAIDKKEE